MTEQNQTPGLSLQDIAAAVQIIDAATQRGAIRGEELVPIGTVRDRFVAFLKHAQDQETEPQDPDAEMPAEDEAE